MIVKPPVLLSALALATVPAVGFAQGANEELSYTYLELDYINLDVDAADDDEDLLEDFDDGGGWGAKGSFAFTPNFFGIISWSETDSDVSFAGDDTPAITANTDIKRFDIGLGFNLPVNLGQIPTDFVGQASYVDIDYGNFDFGGSDDPDLGDLDDDGSDGWAAEAKLRSQIVEWLEGSLGVGYLDIEDVDGFSVVANLLFEFNPNLGINLDANLGDDVSYYSVGLRYSFDRF
jgi:hypothetical protein